MSEDINGTNHLSLYHCKNHIDSHPIPLVCDVLPVVPQNSAAVMVQLYNVCVIATFWYICVFPFCQPACEVHSSLWSAPVPCILRLPFRDRELIISSVIIHNIINVIIIMTLCIFQTLGYALSHHLPLLDHSINAEILHLALLSLVEPKL